MPRRFFGSFIGDYQESGLKYAFKQKWWDIRYPFRLFFRYVSKMFSYGRHLWNDFDFDWVYLLQIMKFKMERMAKAMDKGMTVSAPRHAKEIRHAIAVIDRIINDDYANFGYNKLEEKYGKSDWKFLPIEDSKYSELLIERERARKGTPDYEAERKETMKIIHNAERQRKADIKYLFEYIAKHLQGWWD